ncbi:MAG: FAD:protein FMN transferase [Sphaerochaetaceae bacterium]|nr:FAD:protein FMN transferase [Sphaerochaetaceae bacterium]MDD4007251.1 FAD:protein FMN transferase [Sphaerochaetaceae bacterium]MDD4396105.1 FAD:protein FMN transferase [Sphaerochaetaceae bacterium]
MKRLIRSGIRKAAISGLILLLAVVFTASCSKYQEKTSEMILFGTTCRITASDKADFDAVWKRLGELEDNISARSEQGDLADLNSKAGQGWVEVSQDLYDSLKIALDIASRSNGAFNPAIGELVNLWGIVDKHPDVPSESDLAAVMEHIDWHAIEIKDDDGITMARITDPGVRIDLGGIGKGIAADLAVSLLRKQGIKSALVNFGGNIMCLGSHHTGEPYRIGIQVPFANRNEYKQVVQVIDQSVVTSGPYEKNFVGSDGKLYHHIIDSATGYPADNGLASVTIIGPSSAICDGLSTSCFVLGLDAGTALVQSMEGYSAVFILDDGTAVPVGISL